MAAISDHPPLYMYRERISTRMDLEVLNSVDLIITQVQVIVSVCECVYEKLWMRERQ